MPLRDRRRNDEEPPRPRAGPAPSRRRPGHRVARIVCALLAIAAPLAPSAEDLSAAPSDPAPAGRHRILGGHRFDPSSLVDDPFSSASFGLRIGYSVGTARGRTLAGSPPDASLTCCRDLQYAGILGGIEGSVRLTDWLPLRVGLVTLTYSGLDGESVLTVGSGIKTGGRVQLAPGLDLGDRMRGALLVGVSVEPALDILVLSGLLDAIESGDIEGREVIQTSSTVTVELGGSYAWAPARSLGVSAEVKYLAPQKNGSAAFAANGISAAAAADVDVADLLGGPPLGLEVSYRLIAPIDSSDFRTQQDLRAGITYKGRPGLAAKGEIGFSRIDLRQDLPSDAMTLDASLRYDW
jgi:hypothetical protein